MMRRLGPGRIVIASHNRGKIPEIAELLGPHGIEPVSAIDLDLPEPEEIGTTFIDNAQLKARAAADLSGLPSIADDSGLCVDALGGRPASIPRAGPSARSRSRRGRLWRGQVRARLSLTRCSASMTNWKRSRRNPAAMPISSAPSPSAGRGRPVRSVRRTRRRHSRLAAAGTLGHGYDPMFQPIGREQTFAEMDQSEKNAMSHRADAFRKLVTALIAK
jgi:XTP/dITP diphosphohydrolase